MKKDDLCDICGGHGPNYVGCDDGYMRCPDCRIEDGYDDNGEGERGADERRT